MIIDIMFFTTEYDGSINRVRSKSDGTIWLYTAIPGIREEWTPVRQVTETEPICNPGSKLSVSATKQFLYDLPLATDYPVAVTIEVFNRQFVQYVNEFTDYWKKGSSGIPLTMNEHFTHFLHWINSEKELFDEED